MSEDTIKWPDEEYGLLDKNIRSLVEALHGLGIKTIFSCEGHIREHWYQTGILPWPYVILLITSDEIKILQEKLKNWNASNIENTWILSKVRIHGSYTPEYIKNVIIAQNPGHLVTTICPRSENLGLDSNILVSMQEQAPKLAKFLVV